MGDVSALQMAVKAINDSVEPDSLVPTILVFGTLPRLGSPTEKPTPSTYQGAVALREATEAVTKHFANYQVKDALRTKNGPNVTDIHNAPVGSSVYVYRPEKDRWEGPFSILDINGEDVIVLLPHSSGPTKFRSTVVKPFIASENRINERTQSDKTAQNDTLIAHFVHKEEDMNNPTVVFVEAPSSMRASVAVKSKDNAKFADSRLREFYGLVQRGVFDLVDKQEAAEHHIYGSGFFDEIKNEGKPNAFTKSGLVVQDFGDTKHGFLAHATTVQRSSFPLLMCPAAIDEEFVFFPRDVSHAYVQSDTKVQRPIFTRLPPIICIPTGKVLKVVHPLYGLPESGLHWYTTYHEHHQERLMLKPAVHDPCFLYTSMSGTGHPGKR